MKIKDERKQQKGKEFKYQLGVPFESDDAIYMPILVGPYYYLLNIEHGTASAGYYYFKELQDKLGTKFDHDIEAELVIRNK